LGILNINNQKLKIEENEADQWHVDQAEQLPAPVAFQPKAQTGRE
jgi:hypothetical protein